MILLRVRASAPCLVCGQATDEAVLHNHQVPICHHEHLDGLPLEQRWDLLGAPGSLTVAGQIEVIERPALLVREAA
jgi:hypothetical protein